MDVVLGKLRLDLTLLRQEQGIVWSITDFSYYQQFESIVLRYYNAPSAHAG